MEITSDILIEKKLLNMAILEGLTDYIQISMNLIEQQIGRLISLAVEEENLQMVLSSNSRLNY